MNFDVKHNFIPKEFDRLFVGFDPFIKKLSEAADQTTKLATNYPPYNIKKIDDNKYVIEVAVAGFGKQDLEIEMVEDKLIIKGNVSAGEPAEKDSKGEWTWPQILYQGLAMRPFTRAFNLADNLEIRGANLINGILRIGLEAIIPEHKKPKKIDITETSAEYTARVKREQLEPSQEKGE